MQHSTNVSGEERPETGVGITDFLAVFEGLPSTGHGANHRRAAWEAGAQILVPLLPLAPCMAWPETRACMGIESPGSRTNVWPYPQISELVALAWGPGICTSNKRAGDTEMSAEGCTLRT